MKARFPMFCNIIAMCFASGDMYVSMHERGATISKVSSLYTISWSRPLKTLEFHFQIKQVLGMQLVTALDGAI